jgi:hypothetical protein
VKGTLNNGPFKGPSSYHRFCLVFTHVSPLRG